MTAIAVQGCQKKVPKKHELFTFWCYRLGSLSCLTVILFGWWDDVLRSCQKPNYRNHNFLWIGVIKKDRYLDESRAKIVLLPFTSRAFIVERRYTLTCPRHRTYVGDQLAKDNRIIIIINRIVRKLRSGHWVLCEVLTSFQQINLVGEGRGSGVLS